MLSNENNDKNAKERKREQTGKRIKLSVSWTLCTVLAVLLKKDIEKVSTGMIFYSLQGELSSTWKEKQRNDILEVYKVLNAQERTNRRWWLSLSQYKSKGASHDIGRYEIINKKKGGGSSHNVVKQKNFLSKLCTKTVHEFRKWLEKFKYQKLIKF